MVHLLLAVAVMGTVVAVYVVRDVRRRITGRRWKPMREAMLHDATTLPSTYLARIDTHPEPEAGGHVIATDLINGAHGPLMLRGAAFDPGSVVCFTWTHDGPQIRTWMSGRLWNASTAQAARGLRQPAAVTAWRDRVRVRRAEREIRGAAGEAVATAEQVLRDQSPR